MGPSPPITFCQLNVVTSNLSQGRSIAKAALVASQIVRPSRSSGIHHRWNADTRGGAIPCEHNVMHHNQSPPYQRYRHNRRFSHRRRFSTVSPHRSPHPAPKLSHATIVALRSPKATTWPFQPRRCRTPERCQCGNRGDAQNFTCAFGGRLQLWLCQQRHGATDPKGVSQDYSK